MSLQLIDAMVLGQVPRCKKIQIFRNDGFRNLGVKLDTPRARADPEGLMRFREGMCQYNCVKARDGCRKG
jgi:hypothetical protein